MENQNEIPVSPIPQSSSAQAIIIPIKKHDMGWVVTNILLRQIIVAIPVSLITFLIMGLILFKSGFIDTNFATRYAADTEFRNLMTDIVNAFSLLTFFPMVYIGVKWGCKYVSKETYIDEQDLSKIGYWVGLLPLALGLLTRSVALGAFVFGIFITPRLVQKWLKKYRSEK